MKYLLIALIVLMVGCKEEKPTHDGFCLRCPDSCVVKLTNGLYVYGSGSYRQTIECDCGGGIENQRVVDRDVHIVITDSLEYIQHLMKTIRKLENGQ